ncbi:hypothetical protein L6452_18166 [Arctium lappa]|uniref:Uncharacterized protein n=1 Tax=Arctium lappa TaxID=4217 RepID=A0ACB9C5H2_ARCLA|nr:hypothetical protein L6452_18166 [Arctium lappa]
MIKGYFEAFKLDLNNFIAHTSQQKKLATQEEGTDEPSKREYSSSADETKEEAQKDKGKRVMTVEQEAEESRKKKEAAKYG